MRKISFIHSIRIEFQHLSHKSCSLLVSFLGEGMVIVALGVCIVTWAEPTWAAAQSVPASDSTNLHMRQLSEVEVTSSRAPLARGQQARMVTVLSREEIAAAPVQSVNDLLKYAAGVDVRQRGPVGAQTDVSVRGGNYEQVTILLNGINICDPQTGHNAFDFPVDLADIERIEVLEGPAARVYGTSSLLGAINIVTRTSSRSGLDVHFKGGSFGYFSAGAGGNISKGKWNNRLSGGYTRSDGYSRSEKGSLNMDFSGGKAFYQGNYQDRQIVVKWHAGFSSRNFGSNRFYAMYDNQFEHTMKVYTAIQAENRQGIFHFRPSIYWNHGNDRFELFRGDAVAYPFNYHRGDVFGVNLNSYFDWIAGRTAFGAEIRNEDLVSGNLGELLSHPKPIHGTDRLYTNGLNRTNISFVLEHNILLERFTLSMGFVAVKNTWAEMNMRLYPGLDASYRLGAHWKAYASYNSSLRMPSVTELYYSVGGYKADKHLKPEELNAVEGGVKYLSNAITGSASVYYNHMKNLIDWIRDLNSGNAQELKSVNFGTINALGIEAAVDIEFKHLIPSQHVLDHLTLAYSYISQDKSAEEGIQSRYVLEYLKHKLVANLRLNLWQALHWGVNYRMQDRVGSFTAPDKQMHDYKPYHLIDTRLSWDRSKYKVWVEVNNLFDTQYVDFGSIPQPGIWIMAGASCHVDL